MSNINNILNGLSNYILQIQKKFEDLSPVMELITSVIQDAIDRNFDYGGRWDGTLSNISILSGGSTPWKEHAAKTIEAYSRSKRGITPLLKRSGVLWRQIEVNYNKTEVVISAKTDYAKIQQLGGWAGRNHRTYIPPRPYIVLTEDDMQEIYDILSNFALQ